MGTTYFLHCHRSITSRSCENVPSAPPSLPLVKLSQFSKLTPMQSTEKSTLRHITENLPSKLRENYASCVSQLLAEAAEEYEVLKPIWKDRYERWQDMSYWSVMTCLGINTAQASLRIGTVNMLVRNPEEEKKEKEKVTGFVKSSCQVVCGLDHRK